MVNRTNYREMEPDSRDLERNAEGGATSQHEVTPVAADGVDGSSSLNRPRSEERKSSPVSHERINYILKRSRRQLHSNRFPGVQNIFGYNFIYEVQEPDSLNDKAAHLIKAWTRRATSRGEPTDKTLRVNFAELQELKLRTLRIELLQKIVDMQWNE